MGRTFQRVQLFGQLSVLDNCLLGAEGVGRRRRERLEVQLLAAIGHEHGTGRRAAGARAWSQLGHRERHVLADLVRRPRVDVAALESRWRAR